MNRIGILALPLALVMALPLPAADADAGHEAIKALGSLNGIALACKYIDEVSRMKAAVVANAPKERSYGLAFDEATNAAFLAVIQQGTPCPGKADFSHQVDAAADDVAQAFADR